MTRGIKAARIASSRTRLPSIAMRRRRPKRPVLRSIDGASAARVSADRISSSLSASILASPTIAWVRSGSSGKTVPRRPMTCSSPNVPAVQSFEIGSRAAAGMTRFGSAPSSRAHSSHAVIASLSATAVTMLPSSATALAACSVSSSPRLAFTAVARATASACRLVVADCGLSEKLSRTRDAGAMPTRLRRPPTKFSHSSPEPAETSSPSTTCHQWVSRRSRSGASGKAKRSVSAITLRPQNFGG